MTRTLTITRAVSSDVQVTGDVVPFTDVRDWIRTRSILRHLLRYRNVRLLTQRIEVLPRPFLTALIARALSRGRCTIEDEVGVRESVGPMLLVRLGAAAVRDWAGQGCLLRGLRRRLAAPPRGRRGPGHHLRAGGLYLRTDFSFGLTSGGSVGHIAGVLNNLPGLTGPMLFLTTDTIPTVDPRIETWVLRPDGRYRDFPNLQLLAYNDSLAGGVQGRLAARRPAFVYQRYSLNNFMGAELADSLEIPFVLEYNGSEIWIHRVWGQGTQLPHQQLSEEIEVFNLGRADVIVVVSGAMEDELVERGVDRAKILVNPNGVDTDTYRPDVDGSHIKRRVDAGDRTVIGFIGTFGAWHGAEVLANAYARLLRENPRYVESTLLLMIGDGLRLPDTRRLIEAGGAAGQTRFVGRTRQQDGPSYLAACDILVSPHVPNSDGSRFFGSPTKLFEYMAMGRGIVASRLEQIGEVLEHDRTAWLVEPGNVDDLVTGLRTLIDDRRLRARLGRAAWKEAVARHTWREHTRRIVERIEALNA